MGYLDSNQEQLNLPSHLMQRLLFPKFRVISRKLIDIA